MIQMQALIHDLQGAIGSEQVKFDQMTRLLYSTDASNYQIMPIGVTFPRDADEVSAIHEIANKHQTPILPRGGGSSLAGQTVGQAVVMDFSRYMRRIRSINTDTNRVIVEGGLVLGHLNRQLKPLGYMFGPDPASAERATVGGCIGNNASGSHSILYGMTADHIKRLEVILSTGERLWLDGQSPKLTHIRNKISQLAQDHAEEIKTRFPKTWRSCAGYALNKIDPDDVNLNWLFAGSEGTLGTIIAAELNIVPTPTLRRLAIVHFNSIRASLEATPHILEVNPSAIELLDRFLMDKTRAQPEYAKSLNFIEGDPPAVLLVEFYGKTDQELDSHIQALKHILNQIGHRGAITYAKTPAQQANVWKVRKAGLGLLLSQRGDSKPIAFIEDGAVPVQHLADYVEDVDHIVRAAGTDYAIYAHASAGCLHIRPLINLKTDMGYHQYRQIGTQVAQAVVKYGGTITGEHGKGFSRGEFNAQLFGEQLMGAFAEIKSIFDPQNLMNPGKIIDPPKMDDPSIMRYTPDYEAIELKTRFDWSADGGLSGAAEMCNGAGVCRKEGEGTMCPSYMATRDEAHATRGRANALRLAMGGKLPNDIANQALFDVYSLCLSCKACKAECPSSVDVAQMKSEFLAAYHDINGIPLKSRIFGNVHRLNAIGSCIAGLSNVLLRNPIGIFGAKMMGLPTERPLPTFAAKRFTVQTKNRPKSQNADATLIIDTYTEYNHPEIGLAVLEIADQLGLSLTLLRLPNQGCCGRPAISKGLLDQAKSMANSNVKHLSQLTEKASPPFLFLEPSCLSAFIDDYLNLVEPNLKPQAQTLAQNCISVETWLTKQISEHHNRLQWQSVPQEILLHGHCHQKALYSTKETLALLRHIPNATVHEIDSGCCGVAGSFGYEHYDISMRIANERLLPAIKDNPQAVITAPGTSCRAQIEDAGYTVWHPVQVLAQALKS